MFRTKRIDLGAAVNAVVATARGEKSGGGGGVEVGLVFV